MSWTVALNALRVLLVGGKSAYTIKSYHDKVVKLGGGKPSAFVEKDVKACTNGTMQTAVTNAKKVAAAARAVKKETYAIPETNSPVLWGKLAKAFNEKGEGSAEYKSALKIYLAELRYLDKKLGEQITAIKTTRPIIEANLTTTKAYTTYAKTLESYFMTCAKVPSLGGWQAAFFGLSNDCKAFKSETQSIEMIYTSIIATCKKSLKPAEDLKKANLDWISFYDKTPPSDAAQIKKHATAKKPK